MLEDVATVETQPESSQPSIASAFEAEHGDPTGSKRKPEPGRNTEEENTAHKAGRQRHVVKTQPEHSLADAHDGITPEAAEEFELPEGFSVYTAEDIEAVLGLMGLSDADLKDPRLANLALKELEASFSPVESEDGEESEDDQTEDPTEEDAEEKPEEKKPEEAPKPDVKSKLEDLTPEEAEAMSKHVEEVYQRSKQVNAPIYTEHFTQTLGKALDCPPEQMERLGGVVEILQFGAQNLMETCVPTIMAHYLHQHFEPILNHFVPGIRDAFNEAQASNTWDSVRNANENFADLPDFGTKEFEELRAAVVKSSPWMENFDPGGPPLQALKAKAELFARLAMGEKINPKAVAKQVQEAIATGKKSAETSNRRVSASRMLGRGKTAGSMGKETGDSRESLMDAWTRGGGGGAI